MWFPLEFYKKFRQICSSREFFIDSFLLLVSEMDPSEEYQLTAEEKKRKKKEKIKAKKFSDSEDISDSDVNDPPTQLAIKVIFSFNVYRHLSNLLIYKYFR